MSSAPAAAVLRSVMDGVPAAIAIVDRAGLVVGGNARWNAVCVARMSRLRRADEALYRATGAGRDRTMASECGPSESVA